MTVWGSADNCGGNATLNFNSAVSSNTYASSAKFNFQITLYSGINQASKNESRFTGMTLLGQTFSQSMKNKCWNAMIQFIQSSLTSITSSEFAPSGPPFRASILQNVAKISAPSLTPSCAPPTNCGLADDVNIY